MIKLELIKLELIKWVDIVRADKVTAFKLGADEDIVSDAIPNKDGRGNNEHRKMEPGEAGAVKARAVKVANRVVEDGDSSELSIASLCLVIGYISNCWYFVRQISWCMLNQL